MTANLTALLYLVSGVLFILALRGLSSPVTSRQGNMFGILGMTIAGRTTVVFLRLNAVERLMERIAFLRAGRYPPSSGHH